MLDRNTEPSPFGPDRWRPTRAGLIGLWRYADETFAFHRGRLLLRGPNGSGKSLALELLLPFLLDGDSSPNRLTSAARSRGRLLDRILAGGKEPSRVGFAWVEFCRGSESFTVGARIRGSRTTNKTEVDLFTTSQRVGVELRLLDESRTPLSRAALKVALAADGSRVHDSPEDHRSAIRDVLFPGFSAQRYSSVINALLALRREKLSERLDPDKLSEVLSDALPPLDDHDIAAVAEGFERLDRRRSELATLAEDVEAMRSLSRRQQGYARAVVVAAAARVRSAETLRDDVTRAERSARETLAANESRAVEIAEELAVQQAREAELGVQLEALKDSDAYRAGAGLAESDQQARRYRQIATREGGQAAERAQRQERAEEAVDSARSDHRSADGNAELADRELTAQADRVGADQIAAQARTETDLEAGSGLVRAWARARRELIEQVRTALGRHQESVRRRDLLDEQVAGRESDFADRSTQLSLRRQAEEVARDDFAAAVHRWVEDSVTVGVDRLTGLLTFPVREPAELATAVAAVSAQLSAVDATARQHLAQQRSVTLAEQEQLQAERTQWAGDQVVDPAGPPWRSSRADRPGAPLWRLVDVRPEADDRAVDGLEAALTGAGLLDAWVTPDGRFSLAGTDVDVQLISRPVGGRTAAQVLAPAPDSSLPAEVVTAVLTSLPIADTALDPVGPDPEVVLGLDGSYRLGSAFGRGPVRPAALLGAAARERRRQQRLAELDQALADLDRRIEGLDRELALLDQRRETVTAELAAAPDPAPVTAAVRAVGDAASRLDEVARALSRAREERSVADEAVRTALRELSTLATRHGLPAQEDSLRELETELDRFRDLAQTWVRRQHERRAAERALRLAEQAADQAREDAVRAGQQWQEAEEAALAAEQRFAELESAVGADHREVVARIGLLDAERATVRKLLPGLRAEDKELAGRVGGLRADLASAQSRRENAESEREGAHREFTGTLAALGADAGIAHPEPLDSATAVLAAARAVGAAHDKVDHSQRAIEARSQRVNDQVHTAQGALGGRVDLDRELMAQGWWMLRATVNGLRRGIGDATSTLAAQLEQGRAELAADEERLFEQTLAGSVRRALADRIRQATALVEAINQQLGVVRTAAAGVAVQLRWEIGADQPQPVRAARSLLLRDPAGLSDQDRQALQQFVRARVDQARAELEANAPWEARLRESLDYRAWHRFTLHIAHRDWEGFQPATAARLQRLSTGERSISLHLPMIAAVAAHYQAEDGTPASCPRLILLDELFAGVDVVNRAQLFGAFTAWRLDAVFTSDHEWCQYRDLDGIAIHYLHPASDTDPVTSTRFTWDGVRRVIDPVGAQ